VAEAVQDDAVVRGAEPDHLHDPRQRADGVEVFEGGLHRLGALLSEHAYERAVVAGEIFHQPHGARPSHVDGYDRHRKQNRVPKRQDGDALGA
jgi:hypothetical protein